MTGDLAALFASYPSPVRPGSPPIPLGNGGGLSGADLWRYDSPLGRLVVRAWPVENPDEASLGRIHGWLGSMRDLPFVPIPIAGLDGRTFRRLSGRLHEITPWMPGTADLGVPPRREHFRNALASLAIVHQRLARPSTPGQSPGLSARLREIEALQLGGFDQLQDAIRESPAGELRDLSLRWLASARALAPRVAGSVRSAALTLVPLQPCLRDVRPDHFLFDGDCLSGLVDFGAMGIDSVSADLGRLLPEWLGADGSARSDALAAYKAVRPLSEAEIALISAFEATSSLLIGGRWARWQFVERREFSDPSAVLNGLRRGLDRLALLVRI